MKRELIFKRLADFLKIAMVLSLVFYVSSCDNDDDEPAPMPDPGLVEAAEAANLDILLAALTEADLASALVADRNLTIFAPTDQAFNNFLTEIGRADLIGQNDLSSIPTDVLATVLQYHVVDAGSALASGDLAPSQTETTLANEDLTITVSGGTVTVNNSAVVGPADVVTESGIVHVIDEVLVPPSIMRFVNTIVEPAYFNTEFSTLIAAVNAAPESVMDLLLSNGPSDNGLTLFAPTNEAFEAAGITDLSAVADIVVDVLSYHLIDGTFEADDVLGLDELQAGTLLEDAEVYFSVVGEDEDLFINGTSQVTATDITGSNGVVHVINRTLIPPPGSITDIVSDISTDAENPEFTILLDLIANKSESLDGTPLADILSNPDAEFTVFAPTDAAFNALPEGTLEALTPVQVRDILLYHVIGDAVLSTDLADGAVPTLNGTNITIDATNLTINAEVGIEPGDNGELINILATNGVIHTIDAVLLP